MAKEKQEDESTPARHIYRIHPNSLRAQMINECNAMAKHASASGKIIPGPLADSIEKYKFAHVEIAEKQATDDIAENSNRQTQDYYETMNTELPQPGNFSMKRLAKIHEQIAAIVAPASPRTIVLLSKARQSSEWYSFLGDVALIRRLMVATVFFLIGFVVLALSEDVKSNSGNIFASHGTPLLINLLFLISAAGLGACFALLFKANQYIVDFSYDPKYDSSYWIELVVGLVAGLILSNLIPLGTQMSEAGHLAETATNALAGISGALANGTNGVPNIGNTPSDSTHASGVVAAMGRPVLALLGGFSASLVHRILRRLVDTVGSIFRGDPEWEIETKVTNATTKVAEKARNNEFQTAANLVNLQSAIADGASTEELQKQISRLVEQLTAADNDPNQPRDDDEIKEPQNP